MSGPGCQRSRGARRPRGRALSRALLPLLPLLAACDGVGPFGPIMGGRLQGEVVREPVEDWSFTDAFQEVAVETRPGDPWSVTTWCVAHAGNLYVPTRDPEDKAWVRYALADPRVRVRIGERLYERRAVRVTDPEEFRAALAPLAAKYGLDPVREGDTAHVWLFRMDPP